MTDTSRAPLTHRDRRLATAVTRLSSPAVCVVIGMLVVAWNSASGGADAAWAALAILLCAGVPMAYIAKGVKAGNGSDHHVGRREQRAIPLLVALGSVAIASALLVLVGAPRQLIALVLSQLAGLLVVLMITRFWEGLHPLRHSRRTPRSLLVLFGPWALLGIAPLALIAWSRVVLDAHTWVQRSRSAPASGS